MAELAERYGTPLHVLDEEHVRDTCRTYRRALPGAEIAYAAKAFLCRGLVGRLREEGFGLDVCSAGELAPAALAGMPGERIILHGTRSRRTNCARRCAWAWAGSCRTTRPKSPGWPR